MPRRIPIPSEPYPNNVLVGHILYLLLGKLENNGLSGKLVVDRRERVQLVFHRGRVLGVKESVKRVKALSMHAETRHKGEHVHLDGPVSIGALADSLSGNLGRVDEVFKDLLVNLLQGAGSRSWLLCSGYAAGFADHSSLSDEDDMPVAELLLELSCETV